MQANGGKDRLERGMATARNGQRLAARAQLEQARNEGLRDPGLTLWLAWTAPTPDAAAAYLQDLQEDPEFQGVARAGQMWLEALSKGPDAVRGRNPFAVAETLRLPASQSPARDVRPPSVLDDELPSIADLLPDYDQFHPTEPETARDSTETSDETTPTPTLCYHVACPRCTAKLEVGETALGQDRECPGCLKWFRVPKEGEGALPVVPPALDSKPRPALVPASATSRPDVVERNVSPIPLSSNAPRVLVVDDSPGIRRIAETVLGQAGYAVQTAAGAHEAIEQVRRAAPELILLDIHLGDANGYDVCHALRLFPTMRNVPIVLLTGNDGAYDAHRGRRAGANDYLAKPCESAALVAKVHVHLPSPVLEE